MGESSVPAVEISENGSSQRPRGLSSMLEAEAGDARTRPAPQGQLHQRKNSRACGILIGKL